MFVHLCRHHSERLMLLPATLLLSACGSLSFGDDTGKDDQFGTTTDESGCVVRTIESTSSDKTGYALVPIMVGKDDQAFQVMATRDDGASLTVDYVVDPNDQFVLSYEDWYGSEESLTNAFYLSSSTAVLNFPIRDEEGELSKGTWYAYLGTYKDDGTPQTNKSLTYEVVTRACQGNRAKLDVVIAYAKGLQSDSEVAGAVDAAVEHWREIYDGIGIDLEVRSVSTDLGTALKAPGNDTTQYESLYDEVSANGVVVTIGDSVGGDAGVYGQAGGIPGPFGASPLATVAVAWVIHAGTNGTFSDGEIDLMGETIAHEVGHYLGLFHPVEMTYNYYDALSDTPECTSASSCESKLGENLMYPYPICSGSGCVSQDQLTDDQSVVSRNWVGAK